MQKKMPIRQWGKADDRNEVCWMTVTEQETEDRDDRNLVYLIRNMKYWQTIY